MCCANKSKFQLVRAHQVLVESCKTSCASVSFNVCIFLAKILRLQPDSKPAIATSRTCIESENFWYRYQFVISFTQSRFQNRWRCQTEWLSSQLGYRMQMNLVSTSSNLFEIFLSFTLNLLIYFAVIWLMHENA